MIKGYVKSGMTTGIIYYDFERCEYRTAVYRGEAFDLEPSLSSYKDCFVIRWNICHCLCADIFCNKKGKKTYFWGEMANENALYKFSGD